jgi:hypothetical protein
MIVVSCPRCRKAFSLPDDKEGLKVKCPCGQTFTASQKRGAPAKSHSLLIIGGIVAGGLLIVALFAMSSGKTPPKEEEESDFRPYERSTPVVERPDPGPSAAQREIMVTCRQALEAIWDRNADFLAEQLHFPSYYARERGRLAAEAEEDGRECPLKPWEELPQSERDTYAADLVRRIIHPPEQVRSWRLREWVFDDAEPIVAHSNAPDGMPDLTRAVAQYKLRPKDWEPGTATKKYVLWVHLFAVLADGAWLLEDIGVKVRSKGEDMLRFVPHPLSRDYDKLLGRRGREIDVTRDIESQLSEEGEYVRTADGEEGFAAKPRTIAHLDSTPAEVRRRIDQLMAKMLDPDETTGWKRAQLDLLQIKRASLPALLTSLYGFYKRAVEGVDQENAWTQDDVGKIQKIAQTLALMREQVYEEEYLEELGFSMFEYQGPSDYPRMQRRLRGLAMFWFGWWSQNKDVTPKGELNLPGKRRKK